MCVRCPNKFEWHQHEDDTWWRLFVECELHAWDTGWALRHLPTDSLWQGKAKDVEDAKYRVQHAAGAVAGLCDMLVLLDKWDGRIR